MTRRLFIALFGGRDPGLWRVGDREGFDYRNMDGVIGNAYHIAVQALGGETFSQRQTYQITRTEWVQRLARAAPELLSPGNEYEVGARRAPDEMVTLEGDRRVAIPAVSNNTFIHPAESLAGAIGMVLTVARPGDKISELLLLDHGLMVGNRFSSHRFGVDMINENTTALGGTHAQEFLRLRPYVDAQTVITLAGCSVASNDAGRALLSSIARLLGVHTQGFVEDQMVILPGIEGRTIHCDPNRCLAAEAATPFASRVYGDMGARPYGNDDPGWE
jgi:hypothetical protein